MKKLTDWFDQVYLINCDTRPDRLEETMTHLQEEGLADIEKIRRIRAVRGVWTTVPADWDSPPGAWGCRASHMHALEEMIHSRDSRGDIAPNSALILEDDVFFLENALEDLQVFMENLPANWGQLYLGGQHRGARVQVPDHPHVFVAHSINRTHAYAISRHYVQQIYRHISYAPDYKGGKHVDHQLELAHRRKDWPVFCPEVWICGQRAGRSDISNQENPELTWI